MKTSIQIGICAVFSLGIAEAGAESGGQRDGLPKSIGCAQERGEALGECTYRIERGKEGKITIRVAFANGFRRGLFFEDGKFLKASVTMSGVGTDADWSVEDGMHMIRVDGQRYAVPDILIAGDR